MSKSDKPRHVKIDAHGVLMGIDIVLTNSIREIQAFDSKKLEKPEEFSLIYFLRSVITVKLDYCTHQLKGICESLKMQLKPEATQLEIDRYNSSTIILESIESLNKKNKEALISIENQLTSVNVTHH